MKYRTLGRDGPKVSAIGLGCSGMSSDYGIPDDAESVRTLQMALDEGLNFLDTSDAYGNGKNEELIAGAIEGRRQDVFIATKFGNIRGPSGERGGVNGKPDYIPQACDASLKRLRVETIDLYYQHRVDPDVPVEETVGAMARLVEAGKVRYIGLCEAAPERIRKAHATHPIAALQMEYSLWTREAEEKFLPLLRELGIALVPYAPLGRGFLTGTFKKRDDLISKDRRHAHPRFQEGNFEKNVALLGPIEEIAEAKGVKPAQLALAWVLQQGEDVIPIPGTKRRKYLAENIAALDITLTDDELRRLDDSFPMDAAAGLRYPEFQLQKLGI